MGSRKRASEIRALATAIEGGTVPFRYARLVAQLQDRHGVAAGDRVALLAAARDEHERAQA